MKGVGQQGFVLKEPRQRVRLDDPIQTMLQLISDESNFGSVANGHPVAGLQNRRDHLEFNGHTAAYDIFATKLQAYFTG